MSDSNASQLTPRYRRIVLKISGEALKEPGSMESISPQIVAQVAQQIKDVHSLGVEVAIV
ncbi:MAG: UMP kinase, partial [Verrucomicrobia bacterium]|nr:UMP kinase [Verrucomicrobiota bacterium]